MRRTRGVPVLLLAPVLLSGCASFGRGLAEGLLGPGAPPVDTRQCQVRGRAFEGLESSMRRQEEAAAAGEVHPALKAMMVHGIGSHRPGYATRLAERLALALRLPLRKEHYREFALQSEGLPGELGTLRVSRYFSEGYVRDMFFYELTWDPIVEEEKQNLAYDSSGEYSFRRAGLNDAMKRFVNDTVPDVMMYKGTSGDRIQRSVAQALCWMVTKKWDHIPDGGAHACQIQYGELPLLELDDLVFVSHSLGSRVVLDAFARLAEAFTMEQSGVHRDAARAFSRKRYPFVMLSNQLPLLQLGREPPVVVGHIDEYCDEEGARGAERWVRETRIVAFSDPNDVMSYAVPPRYADRFIDSRLCPTVTNVILNVAPVQNLLGAGEFANPMAAHTSYDDDDRVIALMARGIGGEGTDSLVEERCTWMELR